MKEEHCCGNCMYHKYSNGEWYCINDKSDNYGLETGYDDECENQESRT